MEGYIQALIDIHYMRLARLRDNQRCEQNHEIVMIEELENLLNYYKKATKNPDQSILSSKAKNSNSLYHSLEGCQ